MTPIREVDGHGIGSGTRGPITTALQTAYLDTVRGKGDGHDAWLTAA